MSEVVRLADAPERLERKAHLLELLESARRAIEVGELESFYFAGTKYSGGSLTIDTDTSNFHERLGALEVLKARSLRDYFEQGS